jgi:predicted protein tyrosine phosphatase
MLRHPRLLVLGSSEAAMLLRSASANRIEALISIHGQREYLLDAPEIAHKLELRFDDVESVDLTDPVNGYAAWARQRWSAAMGRPMKPPIINDAKAIVEFASGLADVSGMVLCQCQGEVSRSAAAALLCLATWTSGGDEQYCMGELLRVRPCAAPLRGLVAFGDTLLGRGGKLIEALTKRHV